MAMRIVIDARTLGWTGIGRYVHHLLLELEQLDTATDYQVLLRDVDRKRWQPTAANFTVVPANMEPYSVDEQTKLPALLRSLEPDLVHFLNFTAPLFYSQPYIVTVHDLTLVHFKNVRGAGLKKLVYEAKYWAGRLVLRHVLQASRHIITDVEFVRSELLERYRHDPFPLPAEKITAIHLATDFTHIKPSQPEWIDAKTPFVLYVGNYYPNKNIGKLLEAFAVLAENDTKTKLILCGKADYFQQELQKQAAALGLEKRVVFAGFVPDEALGWLYDHAKLYAFVSLSEGFGIPGLEAMAAGTPVLSSLASCLPEVYGDAALYCDPDNAADIAKQMKLLLEDDKLRKQLIARGKTQVASYSWRRMAEQTLEVYRNTLR